MQAPLHLQEADRLASLRSYQVLDSEPDTALTAIAAAAARVVGCPVGLVTLLDEQRQWFRARVGTELTETPRELAFCAYTVAQESPLVVRDATADPRFVDNALVTGQAHLRFYAGAPLIGRDGLPLGALCVLDSHPRDVTEDDLRTLVGLAAAAVELLELHRLDVNGGLGARDVLRESRELRRGIDTGGIVVHYQPVVTLPQQRTVGVEALLRWQHPQRGLLPPAAFLPIAEASGLVVPLGRQALQQACQQVQGWRQRVPGGADLGLAVNVSGRQLHEPDVTDIVEHALLTSGLPATALTLELTETALVADNPAIDAGLGRLRGRGVKLALDDFGTGYSSAQYLQRFQPDAVKLDRCFVAGLGRSQRDDVIAASLVDLALRLGCDVVAEGIEHPEQARALTRLGVRYAQGFLFSCPRSASELEDHLARTAPRPPR